MPDAGRAAPRGGDVAIVGMAGRFPGSADLTEFWDHLEQGRDLVTEIPGDRWDWRAHTGTSRSRWGGFVPGVDRFDAAFFGISPREAELMDPQQRLLLEVVWTAIEDAGYRASDLAGKRVGVFIGTTNSDYAEVQRAGGRSAERTRSPAPRCRSSPTVSPTSRPARTESSRSRPPAPAR